MQKIWISRTAKIQQEIVYIIYLRNAWICWKIEYPELWKFIGILCTLYMYKMSRFSGNWIFRAVEIQQKIVNIMYRIFGLPKKLNLQSGENPTKNCVFIYLRNVWISKKIECPKLNKLNRKLCPLYVRKVWICRKIQYPELRKFNGKLCTLFIYGMSGLAKKSNLQNCVNSTGNCVQYMYRVSRCVGNLNI